MGNLVNIPEQYFNIKEFCLCVWQKVIQIMEKQKDIAESCYEEKLYRFVLVTDT